jgi:hypothetical protein
MERGYIADKVYGAVAPEWVGGPPYRSFWPVLGLKNRERHPVTTYRCPACGYLESYTP